MKVIIAGSRSIEEYGLVELAVRLSGFHVTQVISGTARGVDRLGEQWARRNGVSLRKMPANWAQHGNKAGYERNAEMAEVGDALVAIWDGKSRGTAHMIAVMKSLNKPYYVVRPDGEGGLEYLADDEHGGYELGTIGNCDDEIRCE